MTCELCKKQPATVHITELSIGPIGDSPVHQRHVCESCARALEPNAHPALSKAGLDIWKLLRQSAQKARAEGSLTCPECGMSLAEFRSKGRLGCPRDYEVFRAHLEPLLLRVHNAKEHRGRIPGKEATVQPRQPQLSELRAQLEAAIREEAYENAARLRDEIQVLEAAREKT